MTEPTVPKHRIALAIALGLALSTAFDRIEGDWPILLFDNVSVSGWQGWNIPESACHVDILLDFRTADPGFICHLGELRETEPGACERSFPGVTRVCGWREKLLWEREALFPNLRIKQLSGALRPRRI